MTTRITHSADIELNDQQVTYCCCHEQLLFPITCKKVKISLLQAVEAPRVARGRGSYIT
jgi:hypothetical protein